MYCLSNFCHLCLKDDSYLIDLSKKLPENATLVSKLGVCISEVEWATSKLLLICQSCLEKLELAYEFKQTCIKSNKKLGEYINILEAQEEADKKSARAFVKVLLPRKSVSNDISEQYTSTSSGVCNIQTVENQFPTSPPMMTSFILANGQQISYQNIFLNFVATTSPNGTQPILMNVAPQNSDVSTNSDITLKKLLETSKPVELNCEIDPSLYDVEHFLSPSSPPPVTTSNIECKACGISYVTYKLLRKHFENAHDGNLPYVCTFCFTTFLVQEHYDKHMKSHLDIYDHGIPEKSVTLDKLPKKLRVRLQGNVMDEYPCYECSKIYVSYESLMEHMKETHTKKLKKRPKDMKPTMCHICYKDFSTESYLKLHMKLHGLDDDWLVEHLTKPDTCKNPGKSLKGMKTATCDVCYKGFSRELYLRKHMRLHGQYVDAVEGVKEKDVLKKKKGKSIVNTSSKDSNEENKNEKENDDSKITENNIENNNEMKDKLKGKDDNEEQCKFCGISFKKKVELRRHINIMHIKSIQYKCHLCEIDFSEGLRLARHLRTHYSSLSCSECHRIFSSISEVTEHMRNIHMELKAVVCGVCTNAFDSIPEISAHMEKHLAEIVYKCHICNQEFGEHRHLTTHVLEHNGMKNCRDCKRYFYSEEEFEAHKNSCQDGKYKCEHCPRTFWTKRPFFVHVRSHFSEEGDNAEAHEKKPKLDVEI